MPMLLPVLEGVPRGSFQLDVGQPQRRGPSSSLAHSQVPNQNSKNI